MLSASFLWYPSARIDLIFSLLAFLMERSEGISLLTKPPTFGFSLALVNPNEEQSSHMIKLTNLQPDRIQGLHGEEV